MIKLRLCIFGKKTAKVLAGHLFSVHHIRGLIVSGNINLDHLVKVVSASFLHCTVFLSSFVINKYLVGRFSEIPIPTDIPISHTFCSLTLASIEWFLPAVIITVVFYCRFSISILSSIFINWNFRKTICPFSPVYLFYPVYVIW